MREIDFEVEMLLKEWLASASIIQNFFLEKRTNELIKKLRAPGKQDQLTAHEASGY